MTIAGLSGLASCSAVVQRSDLKAACAPGTRACGGECVPEAADRFESEGACLDATICGAGEYLTKDRTPTSDRECDACPEGTFSDQPNADACFTLQVCTQGEFEAVPPSDGRDRDRGCLPCEEGTFTSEDNARSCQRWSECPAGEVPTAAATRFRDLACAACAMNEYAQDGVCRPVTQCTTGQFLSRVPTSTTDAQCAPHSDCPPGTFVEAEPTPTTDRQCTPCPAGRFSGSANASACAAFTECGEGRWESVRPDATRDRQCRSVSDCQIGQLVQMEATATSDRVCAWCAEGLSAVAVNAKECQSWTAIRMCRVEEPGRALVCHGQAPLWPPGPDGEPDAAAATSRQWLAVSNGDFSTCAIPADSGEPICWGFGAPAFDAVGQGRSFTSVSISATFDRAHACGIFGDGQLYCWGSNEYGKATPPPGVRFTSVSAGGHHTCGVLADSGHVRCWGQDTNFFENYGQVTQTPTGVAFSRVSAGLFHSCGLRKDNGRALCWGLDKDDNTLGSDDEKNQVDDTPLHVEFVAVSAGAFHSCGVRKDNAEIQCWGIDDRANPFTDHGQVRHTPKGVRFRDVIAGGGYTCGVREEDGRLQCWGSTVWQ